MRHYLALLIWHAEVQIFQQFSIENFIVRGALGQSFD